MTKTELKIAEAAWRLAAKGWENVTLAAVAKAARLPMAAVKKHAADERAFLPLMVAQVTHRATRRTGRPLYGAAPRDTVFDHLMARFDVLQNHRAAVGAIWHAARRDVALVAALLRAQHDAMRVLARQAGFKDDLISSVSCILLGVYLDGVRIWRIDQSLDLAKTMAALDRRLSLVERVFAYLRMSFASAHTDFA